MTNPIHHPVRMCQGCNARRPKNELLRIVKIKNKDETELILDHGKKAQTRGAYLCKNGNCLKRVQKSKRLSRTFSCRVDDAFYDQLREAILAP